jgi:hypothetical protein
MATMAATWYSLWTASTRTRIEILLFRLRLMAPLLVFVCFLSPAAEQPQMTPEESAKLKSFLRNYLQDSYKAGDTTTRYFATLVDLTGDGGREAIIYFTDQHSCGSGGCTTLILAPRGSSYGVITAITIGWPPIRVLSTRKNGWRDLGIWVQGGGIQPGYEAELQFDGKTYPRNPSVPPAKPLIEKVTGKVVVPKGTVGALLY